MEKQTPLVSVVIATYNGAGFLQDCVGSVLRSTGVTFEVIVVDNASTDNSISALREEFGRDRRLRILANQVNLLFTGGYNTGIKASRGGLIVALNNDTEVAPEWLDEIQKEMARDESIGAAQPKVLVWGSDPAVIDYAGASIDRFGFAFGYGMGQIDRGQFDNLSDIFYAGGTAMVLRREALEKVGLFDEKFGMHWEDVDLSWRMHLAGYRVVLIPRAVIYHKGSLSMKKISRRSTVVWYVRKNRLAGLMKNYSDFYFFTLVPCLVLSYAALALKEWIVDRNGSCMLDTLRAMWWNIKELPYVMRQRNHIQRTRVVPDRVIMRLMRRRPVCSGLPTGGA